MILLVSTSSKSVIQWRAVLVVPACHLDNLRVMSLIERPQFSFPTQRLGVMTVAAFALCQDRPYRMKLAVFAEKVRPAQPARRNVPDTHLMDYIRWITLPLTPKISPPGLPADRQAGTDYRLFIKESRKDASECLDKHRVG